MRIGNMGFWPSAVAGGFFILRGKRAGEGKNPAPTETLLGMWEKNPPVTASPCQPPLGKGAEGTGDADCHSQCAHWLRNDIVNKRCGISPGGRTGASAPTEGLQGVRWAGDRKGRPYGGLQEGAVRRADGGSVLYGIILVLFT